MNELVFKGQDDQVLTNSLYTDTTLLQIERKPLQSYAIG